MDIEKICTRLGLENCKQLASMLNFDDRSERIYRLSNKVVTCKLDNQVKVKDKVKDKVSLNQEVVIEKTNQKNNFYRQGWACVLKSISDKELSKEERKKLKNPNGFPKGNIPKGDGSDWYFHRGHILAYSFASSLTNQHRLLNNKYNWDGKSLWNSSLVNDKQRNLFTQFSYANEIQDDIEQQVRKLFSDGASKIFYEVTIVKHSKEAKIPIGTQIYYKVLESSNAADLESEGHYFIPNFDKGFNLSKIVENVSYEIYRNFYTNGCDKEKYLSCFLDYRARPQNNWQANEGEVYTITSSDNNFSLKVSDEVFEKIKKELKIANSKTRLVQDGEQWKIEQISLTKFTSGTLRLQGGKSQDFSELVDRILSCLQ